MGADSYHFTVGRRARTYGRWDPGKKEVIKDDLEPAKVRCANCGQYVRFIVQTIQVYKLAEGDPRIQQLGKDKVFRTENWCLQCIRAGNVEDDSTRTFVNIGGMS